MKISLFGGDWNVTMQTQLDRSEGSFTNNKQSYSRIKEWTEELDFIDIWRNLNLDKGLYTWFRKHPAYRASILDYFIISLSLSNMVNFCNIVPGFKTNHKGIGLCFRNSVNTRDHGGILNLTI